MSIERRAGRTVLYLDPSSTDFDPLPATIYQRSGPPGVEELSRGAVTVDLQVHRPDGDVWVYAVGEGTEPGEWMWPTYPPLRQPTVTKTVLYRPPPGPTGPVYELRPATIYRAGRHVLPGWQPAPEVDAAAVDDDTVDLLVHDPAGDVWVCGVREGTGPGEWMWPLYPPPRFMARGRAVSPSPPVHPASGAVVGDPELSPPAGSGSGPVARRPPAGSAGGADALAVDEPASLVSPPDGVPVARRGQDSSAEAPVGGEPRWLNMADPQVTEAGTAAVVAAVKSGCLSAGPQTKRWEDEVALLVAADHVVATSSCTMATHIALAAAGVGPGDEVIVPAVSWPSTVWAIRATGATAVVVDIDPDTWMLSPDTVTAALTPATKVVIAVDYAGALAPVAALCNAVGPNVLVLEDAAHAFGSGRAGRPAGADAAVTVWSWTSTNTCGVGELGALTTTNFDLAEQARSLRSYGLTLPAVDTRRDRVIPHDVVAPGPNAKPAEVTCALAVGELPHVRDIWQARSENLARYRAGIAELAGDLRTQQIEHGDQVIPYVAPVLLADPARRDRLLTALRAAKIEAGDHHPALHHYPGVAPWVRHQRGELPVADWFTPRILTLPVHEGLSADDVDRVLATIDHAR